MCFDVPKVVRSPGCDHGHDEESRNGRDIKIDILDSYIRTPDVFRVISEKTGVPEGYRNPPGELVGLMGLSGEREGPARAARAPCLLTFTTWPMRPITFSSYSCNSPVPPKIPESLGTFPMYEYSRPIYQSLCLDHFETPRHVRDHIRDSEQTSVHQNL